MLELHLKGGTCLKCPKCNSETPPESKFCKNCGARVTLYWFEPEPMGDLFGFMLLANDIKEIREMLKKSPTEVKEELLLEMQGPNEVLDAKQEMIVFVKSYLLQVLAEMDPDVWGEFDVDNLSDRYGPLFSNVRKRAQVLAKHVNDPRTAWNYYCVEKKELERRNSTFGFSRDRTI